MKFVGWLVLLSGLWYCTSETIHYGSNWVAKSDGEVMADGLSLIIMALGLILIQLERKNK